MKLTENELKEIRHIRISNYRKRIDKFSSAHAGRSTIDGISHNILVDDLADLIAEINEVENELNEKYPKWNECPF